MSKIDVEWQQWISAEDTVAMLMQPSTIFMIKLRVQQHLFPFDQSKHDWTIR